MIYVLSFDTDVKLLYVCGHMTYQKTLKLLGLSDVNPAVFFNDFDVFYLIIKSVKPNTGTIEKPAKQNCFWLLFIKATICNPS